MSATVQVQGTAEAIKALGRIDPASRKQFTKDAKRILQPAMDEIRRAYPAEALSGMARKWEQRNRQKFPYDQARARKGVVAKIDTRKRAASPIKIIQRDSAATIMEFAGRGKSNPLAQSLDSKFGRRSRFAWPAALRRLPDVQREMKASVLKIVNRVNKEVR